MGSAAARFLLAPSNGEREMQEKLGAFQVALRRSKALMG